jgi:putative ABC transport system substrate-binding protein
MDRRRFIGAVATGVTIVPATLKGQPAGQVRRIAWLANWAPQTPAEFQDYTKHLRALGWIEGKNLVIERRYTSGNTGLLAALADELIRLKVEIIVAESTVVALAVKKATNTIPIVVAKSGDPVRAGLVASLARPGGNVTGTSTLAPDLDQKRIQLLRELLPEAVRVGELIVPANPINRDVGNEHERTYRVLGFQPIFVEVAQAGDLDNAIAGAARRGSQALRVSAEPLLGQNFDQIVSAAQRYSMPVMADNAAFLENGAIASYGPEDDELLRQLAFCIDKILRGAKPADVPIQQPRKFELGINLKVAKSFGIAVPQALLQRADLVIQ